MALVSCKRVGHSRLIIAGIESRIAFEERVSRCEYDVEPSRPRSLLLAQHGHRVESLLPALVKEIQRLYTKCTSKFLYNRESRIALPTLDLTDVGDRQLNLVGKSFLAEATFLPEFPNVQPEGARQSHKRRRNHSLTDCQSL